MQLCNQDKCLIYSTVPRRVFINNIGGVGVGLSGSFVSPKIQARSEHITRSAIVYTVKQRICLEFLEREDLDGEKGNATGFLDTTGKK